MGASEPHHRSPNLEDGAMFRRKPREQRAPLDPAAALPAEPLLAAPDPLSAPKPQSESPPMPLSAQDNARHPETAADPVANTPASHTGPSHTGPSRPARNPLSHLPNIGDAARRPTYPGLPGFDRHGPHGGHGGHDTPQRSRPAVEGRKLIVGRDIELTGSIAACDTLVVEGRVDSTLSGASVIEVATGGTFHGTAEVEHAEIAGTFEGDLTVNKKLSLARTGRIIGTVRYTTLEVEAGGQIQGTAEVLTARKET